MTDYFHISTRPVLAAHPTAPPSTGRARAQTWPGTRAARVSVAKSACPGAPVWHGSYSADGCIRWAGPEAQGTQSPADSPAGRVIRGSEGGPEAAHRGRTPDAGASSTPRAWCRDGLPDSASASRRRVRRSGCTSRWVDRLRTGRAAPTCALPMLVMRERVRRRCRSRLCAAGNGSARRAPGRGLEPHTPGSLRELPPLIGIGQKGLPWQVST